MQKSLQFIQKEPIVWGPIFLLCTVALAAPFAIPYDLLLLTVGGFFLSARQQIRGFCYSLVFLGLLSVFRHAFFVTDHIWQLGIEGSIALSFLITALASEKGSLWISSLESQIETRKSALHNLEEEFGKVQQATQEQQIIFQEKVALLQKEIEELQMEHSSTLILNEVLRKTTARHLRESQEALTLLKEAKTEKETLRKELIESEKEVARIKNSDALVLQTQDLLKELNQARFEKEQTHLINETLVRQHVLGIFKAKEAENEAGSLKDLLRAAHQEISRIEDPLKQKLEETKREAATLKLEFEKANEQANRARQELLKLHEIQSERNFLKERLNAALLELERPKIDPQVLEKLKTAEEKVVQLGSQLQQLNERSKGDLQKLKAFEEKVVQLAAQLTKETEEKSALVLQLEQKPKVDEAILEQLQIAEGKIVRLSQIEPIFKQLKTQFQEKNQVLHEARQELFKSDTELQKLKIEKMALELNPIPQEVEEEFQALSERLDLLEEENALLQELVSHLSQPPEQKKKVKKESTPKDQTLLF